MVYFIQYATKNIAYLVEVFFSTKGMSSRKPSLTNRLPLKTVKTKNRTRLQL